MAYKQKTIAVFLSHKYQQLCTKTLKLSTYPLETANNVVSLGEGTLLFGGGSEAKYILGWR